MKRHNGKSVQWQATNFLSFRDASDVDYSTEEEEDQEEGEGDYAQNEEERPEHQESDQDSRPDDIAAVEPLKGGARGIDSIGESQAHDKENANDTGQNSGVEKARTSDEMFEFTGMFLSTPAYRPCVLICSDDATSSISRKGTPRNTDSFFKDDNAETKKINLTPSLLRDDSSGSAVRSIEAKEVCVYR